MFDDDIYHLCILTGILAGSQDRLDRPLLCAAVRGGREQRPPGGQGQH